MDEPLEKLQSGAGPPPDRTDEIMQALETMRDQIGASRAEILYAIRMSREHMSTSQMKVELAMDKFWGILISMKQRWDKWTKVDPQYPTRPQRKDGEKEL